MNIRYSALAIVAASAGVFTMTNARISNLIIERLERPTEN